MADPLSRSRRIYIQYTDDKPAWSQRLLQLLYQPSRWLFGENYLIIHDGKKQGVGYTPPSFLAWFPGLPVIGLLALLCWPLRYLAQKLAQKAHEEDYALVSPPIVQSSAASPPDSPPLKEYRDLQIPAATKVFSPQQQCAKSSAPTDCARRQRVYCAGPFFNPEQIRTTNSIASTVEAAGYATFLPQRDGIESSKVWPLLERRGHNKAALLHAMHQAIFALDAYQVLVNCDITVANLIGMDDGNNPDSGTVSEAAMAWRHGKPVFFFKPDGNRVNSLVLGLTPGFDLVEDISTLPDKLASADLEPRGSDAPLPDIVSQGGALWRAMKKLPKDESRNECLATLIESMFMRVRADSPRPASRSLIT